MNPKIRQLLLPIIAVLFCFQAVLQGFPDYGNYAQRAGVIKRSDDPQYLDRVKRLKGRHSIDRVWSENYAPKGSGLAAAGLSPEQLLVAIGGLREFVAGILWVRADTFFHTGNYDAILPMVRIVTWLDPHQIDVYSTGAWHMAYNFTDEQQRSDRRYLAPALTLLGEGVRNNPSTYELYFENGWMYFNKIEENFDKSANWFKLAWDKPDILEARRNMLAHAYEKDGRLDLAQNIWYDVLNRQETILGRDPSDWQNRVTRDTAENNLDMTLVRTIARKYDTNPPIDVNFMSQVTVTDDRKLLIQGGLAIPALGPRVRCVLKDAGYNLPKPTPEFSFDEVQKDKTYMQDSLYVRATRFEREIDLTKDPSMYSFKAPAYDIVFTWNPRLAAPHIQDRIGYSGEGVTDKRYLVDGYALAGEPKPDPNAKWNMIYCKVTLSRDQLLRKGEWAKKVPIVRTPNYVAPPPPPPPLALPKGTVVPGVTPSKK